MLSFSTSIRFALPMFALIALFWGCLYSGDVLAFRDAMHFYYPLWEFLDRSSLDYWLLPHFNHLDRVGVPLIAEPTTMTFYPGRLLLGFPFISLEQSIAVFLVVHLGIAWFGSYLSVRRVFRRSTFAASVAASSYTFGGFAYFQIYNAPYLVSSAWLPFAFGALFAITHQGRSIQSIKHWQALLIISLIAMCLAGDFQLPYNLGLLAIGLCAAGSLNKWRRNRSAVAANSIKGSASKSFAIAVCFCLAALCTAIQSIPTYRWMTLGNTSEKSVQRGISDRYTFQTSDLLTCVMPNCLGNYTPTHTRWVAGMMQDSMWVASIHNGVPAIATIIVLGLGFAYRRTRLLGLVVFTSIVLAAGDSLGLYSILKWIAPFYDGFRYPMKWFAITSHGLCILTAFGMDACLRNTRMRSRVTLILWLLFALNVSVGGFALAVKMLLPEWLSFLSNQVPADRLCGGFDVEACLKLVLSSALVTAATAGIIAMLLKSRFRLKGSVIEAVALLHLVVCAYLTTSTIDPSTMILTAQANAQWVFGQDEIPVHWNSDRTAGQPTNDEISYEEFIQHPRTAAEIARFQKQNVVGKLHLLDNARSFSAQLSLEPEFYQNGPELAWLQDRIEPQVAAESFRISLEPNKIVIELLAQDFPLEITLPVLQDGGWSCSNPAIAVDLADDRLLRLRLPPKVQHVTLTYFTPGLQFGALVTFLSLILVVVYFQRSHV